MVTVLGDKVNVALPETEDSIVLFLDINHQDIEQLSAKNPQLTYIITTRKLEEYKSLLDLGFFNIVFEVNPADVSQKYIIKFLETKYTDNRLQVIINALIPLYREYGNAVNCISALLVSIREADLEAYETLIKFNLDTMQEAVSQIELMYTLAASLYSDKDNLEKMKDSIELVNRKDSDIQMYKSKIDELFISLENSRQDVSMLSSQFKEAQSQIAELSTREVDIDAVQKHPAFVQLKQQFDTTTVALADTEEEFKKLQLAAGILNMDGEGMDTKDKVIAQLRKDLYTVKTTSWDQLMDKQIPAVTDNVTLNAQAILYIKEVKPTIYINSLAFWLSTYLTIKYQKEQHKTFIVIVFDPLINQFSRTKYAKRGWAINAIPNANTGIVVTNTVSLDFLKGTLHINEYDFVVVIDRFGLMKDVVSARIVHKYCLINTPNDIGDYCLDPQRCIGFFNVPPDQAPPCKYVVSTTDSKLYTMETERRSYKVFKDGIWVDILREIGVIENV